jgi:hypothetical protein
MRISAALTLVVCGLGGMAQAQSVRDPNASFLDVPARRAELREVANPRLKAAIAALKPCPAQTPAPPAGRMRVPMYYLNGSHGPVNPDYDVATALYTAMERTVAVAATRYAATGEPAEAQCVVQVLAAWAQAQALLDYSRRESAQAWFVVE